MVLELLESAQLNYSVNILLNLEQTYAKTGAILGVSNIWSQKVPQMMGPSLLFLYISYDWLCQSIIKVFNATSLETHLKQKN